MENTFAITEENRELVDGVILLVAENETDESVFRRLFTQLGIICNEYIVITRIGQRSINGYFAKKGTKKQHKFVPEMDEDLLETKVGSAGLVHGKDFFSNASDYITFVEAQLVPLAKKYDEQVVDGGDGLLDFWEVQTSKMTYFLEVTRIRMTLVKKSWATIRKPVN